MLERTIGDAASLSAQKTILLVEDNISTRLATAQDLMGAGFHVIQAASGVEAWRILQRYAQIDLVLTDIHMPGGVDGIDLARWLRALRPDLKVVFLSGDLKAARSAGIGHLLIEKPYQPSDLVKEISNLLDHVPDNDKP